MGKWEQVESKNRQAYEKRKEEGTYLKIFVNQIDDCQQNLGKHKLIFNEQEKKQKEKKVPPLCWQHNLKIQWKSMQRNRAFSI